MLVKWLSKALQNLEDEASYIAHEDPIAAQLVVRRIIDAINLLADKPALGHPGRIYGTRELVVPNTRYIVPCRVRPRLERIETLRICRTGNASLSRKVPPVHLQ